MLALDAAANGYALYVLIPSSGATAGRFGQGLITLLAFAVATTARALNRSFAPRASAGDQR